MPTILFIAASPPQESLINYEEELNIINESLINTRYGIFFKVVSITATKRNQLIQNFEKYRPDIIHFSGHGNKKSEIILESSHKTAESVPIDILKDIFELSAKKTKCVVLNCCYSAVQAQIISEVIEGVVIGSTLEIKNTSATAFSKEFYRQISDGKNISYSFKAAVSQTDETKDKFLVKKNGTDERSIFFDYSNIDFIFPCVDCKDGVASIIRRLKKSKIVLSCGNCSAKYFLSKEKGQIKLSFKEGIGYGAYAVGGILSLKPEEIIKLTSIVDDLFDSNDENLVEEPQDNDDDDILFDDNFDTTPETNSENSDDDDNDDDDGDDDLW